MAALNAGSLGRTPATGSGATRVVDGWMPAVSAANAARLEQQAQAATDGWAPALAARQKAQSDRLAAEVTDGWAGSLLK